ncbi:hypothetical protein [Emticicia fluvialis]|uniref:hypothetical protein n=1 Tax=Emticicia fluvialis TaxID=2974474 RepID=UPI0021651111|nr:hypothetical protein [Emticicia fluvialis]
MKNEGFDPAEIAELKAECKAEGQNYIVVEDEDGMSDSGEFAHIQFVGKHDGAEVIYDAVISTLRLNHSSLVFEEAEERMKKAYPNYVEVDRRKANYKMTEDMELMLEEIIEELEEEEVIKVSEFLDIDEDFEYGIGLDVSLNVEEITDEVVTKFVNEFNAGTLKLDNTLYSFTSEEE